MEDDEPETTEPRSPLHGREVRRGVLVDPAMFQSTPQTLAEAKASVAKCQGLYDTWSRRMNLASQGVMICFVLVVVLAWLQVDGRWLEALGAFGIALWLFEHQAFAKAMEWHFWKGQAYHELENHPDYDARTEFEAELRAAGERMDRKDEESP